MGCVFARSPNAKNHPHRICLKTPASNHITEAQMRPKEKSEEEGALLGASDTPGQITAWAEGKLMCRKVFRCNYTCNAVSTSQKNCTWNCIQKQLDADLPLNLAMEMIKHSLRSDMDPVHPQDGWFASRVLAFSSWCYLIR